MICKVRQTVERYNLFSDAKSIAVGVSGGADSMCLLEILNKLKSEYDIILKVVHVNHNIRGEEALRDQLLVEKYCKQIGVECIVHSVDVPTLSKELGIGEEECGRIKRYECFAGAGCDLIATAHTLSDSIETMVFNLIRGTGTKGLCGIPPKRDNVIRPLIDCNRNEIEDFCRDNDIPYVVDSTNLTDDYTRNFIRHNIIADFSKVNESFSSAFSGAMEILRGENDFLNECKDGFLDSAKTENGYDASSFASAHPALRRRAIACILEQHMQKDVEKRHIDLANAAITKGSGKIELAKGLYFTVSDGTVSVESEKKAAQIWECTCEESCFSTPVGIFRMQPASSAEYNSKNAIDADKINGQLIMSSRKDGDRFYSKKRKNTKSLKKLFNEAGIPVHERNSIAVLRDGENVIWIDGFGTDGKYLPDINTKNVLIIKKEG